MAEWQSGYAADCSIAEKTNSSPIILLRSTIIPGTSSEMQKRFPHLKIVFNPEFLTEDLHILIFSVKLDLCSEEKKKMLRKLKLFINIVLEEEIAVIKTDFESAELIKYVCNNYFATKVSFLNEMKLISDKIDANWDHVMEGFLRDGQSGVLIPKFQAQMEKGFWRKLFSEGHTSND